MKSLEWKTYRTRFLVHAKQLNSALTFVDHLGRQHCGRKGDYLVESFEGVLSITPRRIFEDIYVPMSSLSESQTCEARTSEQDANANEFIAHEMHDTVFSEMPIENLDIEAIGTSLSQRSAQRRPTQAEEPARVRRKLPQPCRDRRSSPSRFNLM